MRPDDENLNQGSGLIARRVEVTLGPDIVDVRFLNLCGTTTVVHSNQIVCDRPASFKCSLISLRDALICLRESWLLKPLQFVSVEQNGWPLINVKHKHHGADKKDEGLHRNLGHGIEQQALSARGNRPTGQISLHLGLVRAEISQGKEHSSKKTAPKVVAIIPVELGGHQVQFSGCACEAHRIAKRDMRRQEEHRAGECRCQSHRHHEHLQRVRPGGCLYSTFHCKDHGDTAHDQRRRSVGPTEYHGQHDGGGIQSDPQGKSALN